MWWSVQVHISVADVGGVTVFTVDGSIDLASVGTFHSELTRLLRRHHGEVLAVDLDAVTLLDDVGLGVLLGAAAGARDAGGDIEIVCTRPTLRDRLAHTRLDRAVTVRSAIST